MHIKKHIKTKGFTLIELMITVAIVAILASIALPSYIDSVRKARRTDGLDALLDCSAQQTRNYSSSSPPSYYTSTTAHAAGACLSDGTNFNSREQHYTLAITNPSCTSSGNSTWCYLITATAVSAQADDTDCSTFSIDHRGVKTAKDSASNDSTDTCWKK